MDDDSLRKLLAAVLGPAFGAAVIALWSWRKKSADSDVRPTKQAGHKAYLLGRQVRSLWDRAKKR